MTLLRSSLCLLATLLPIGCMAVGVPGSGNVITQSRTVSTFSQVVLEGAADIVLVSGAASTSCEVEADDNLLAMIETRVDGNVLTIRMTGTMSPTRTPIVRLQTTNVDRLSINGSGDVDLSGLKEEAFTLSIAGSGSTKLAGSCESLSISIMGSGSINADACTTQSTSVSISGSGDATLNVEKELSVSITGSGDVRYRGNAAVSESIMGSGSVIRQ